MNLDVPSADVEAAGGIASYQIAKATEISLRNVQQLENEYRAKLRAPAPAAPAPTAAAPAPGGKPAPGAPTAVDHKDMARQLHDAVLEANVDDLASVIEKIMKPAAPEAAPSAPAPAPAAAPTPSAARPVVNRTAEEIASANAIFDREFAHLTGNTAAMESAREQIIARMRDRKFDPVPLDMLVRDIGSRMSAAVGQSASPTPSQQEQLEVRRQVKARMPAASNAGAVVPAPPAAPAQTRPVRHQSYVQRLRSRSGSNSALAAERIQPRR